MTHLLQLVRDTSIIDIASGSNYKTWEYNPQPPGATLSQIIAATADGTSDSITVTEPLRMMIYGSSRSEVRQYVNLLETRMWQAEQYATKRQGFPVYLYLRMDGIPTTQRSQILSGRWVPDESTMYRWAANAVEGTLYVTRQYFWEPTQETQIKLQHFRGDAPSLNARYIYNNTNTAGNYGNYVNIPPGTIAGVLPTPARIELANLATSQRVYSNIYIANYVSHTGEDRITDMIQGENNIATSSGTAESGYSGYSDGGMLTCEFSGLSFPAWLLSAAAVQQAAGRSFRLFARLPWYTLINGNVIYIKPQITQDANSAADINPYQYERALPTQTQNELNDLGTLTLGDYPGSGALALRLSVRSAAAVRVEFDWLQALPADNFRHLVYRGFGVAPDEKIVDDPYTNRAYQEENDGTHSPVINAKGRPILLYPDSAYAQRIYFLHDQNGRAPTADGFKVRMWYRPRRLTI